LVGVRCGGVGDVKVQVVVINEGGVWRERSGGVLEGKEGIGEVVKGLANAVGVREGKENVMTAVMVYGRGEVKGPSPMFCPRRPS
jgi:hypothetical protein